MKFSVNNVYLHNWEWVKRNNSLVTPLKVNVSFHTSRKHQKIFGVFRVYKMAGNGPEIGYWSNIAEVTLIK